MSSGISAPIRVLVRIRPMTRPEYTDGENTHPAVIALSENNSSSNDPFGVTSELNKGGGGTVRVFSPAHLVSGGSSSSFLPSTTGHTLSANQSSLHTVGIAGKQTETQSTHVLSSTMTSSISEQTPSVIHDQTFDRVFPPTSSQQDVFDELVELVSGVAAGVNATVFAYGQTGTGKTHTMMGSGASSGAPPSSAVGADKNLWGVIPRATELLFKKLDDLTLDGNKGNISNAVIDGKRPPLAGEGSPSPVRITVMLSYMQIYNDKVYDLLSSSSHVRGGGGRVGGTVASFEKPLAIREGKRDEDNHNFDKSNDIRAMSGTSAGTSLRNIIHMDNIQGNDDRMSSSSRRSLSARRVDHHEDATAKLNTPTRKRIKGERGVSPINTSAARTHSSGMGMTGTNVHVVGLSQHPVSSFAEVAVLLHRGSAMRAVRSTEFNEASSRSHAVLQFSVEIQREVAPVLTAKVPVLSDGDSTVLAAKANSTSGRVIAIRRAKLNLVDLAGSEKWYSGASSSSSIDMTQHNSGAVEESSMLSIRPHSSSSSSSSVAPNRAKRDTRDRARELVSINKSLSALGNCIAALAEVSESLNGGGGGMRLPRTHIPYRDSALTRLLRDSLGGNTRTAIIATISPSVTCLEETFSTLNFAGRARRVFCRVRVNEHATEALQLDRARREILRLRKELDAYKRLDALVVKASSKVVAGVSDSAHPPFDDTNDDEKNIEAVELSSSDVAAEVTRRVAAVLSLSPNHEKSRLAQEIDAAAVHAAILSPHGNASTIYSSSALTEGLNNNTSQLNSAIDTDILELIYSLALSSPLVAKQKDPNQYQPHPQREDNATVYNSPLNASTQSRSKQSGLSPPSRLDSNHKISASFAGNSNPASATNNNSSSSSIIINSKSPESHLLPQQQLRMRRPSLAALHLAQSLGVSPSVLLSTGLMKSPYAQPVLNSPGGRHTSLITRHALQKLALEESTSSLPITSDRSLLHSTSPRLISSSRISQSFQRSVDDNIDQGFSRGMASSVGESEYFTRANSDDEGETKSPFSVGSKRQSPASHRITVSPPTSTNSPKYPKSRAAVASRPSASPIIIELDTTIQGQGLSKLGTDRIQDSAGSKRGATSSAAAKRRAFIEKNFSNTANGVTSLQESSEFDNIRSLRRSTDRAPVVGYTAEYPNYTSDGSGVIVQSSHPIIFFSPQKSSTVDEASVGSKGLSSNGDIDAKYNRSQVDSRGFYSPPLYPSRTDKHSQIDAADHIHKPVSTLNSQSQSVRQGSSDTVMYSANKGRVHLASESSAPLQLSPSPSSRVISKGVSAVDESTSPSPPLLSVFFSPPPDNIASLSAHESFSTTALGNAFSSPPPRASSSFHPGSISSPSPFEMSIAAGRKLDAVIHSSGPTTPTGMPSTSSADSGFAASRNFSSSGFSSSGFFYHNNASTAPYASPKAALPSRKGSAASVTAGLSGGLTSPSSRRASTETLNQQRQLKSSASGILFSPTLHGNATNIQIESASKDKNKTSHSSAKTAEDFVQDAIDEEITRDEEARIAALKPPGPPKTPRPTPRLVPPTVSRIDERTSETTTQQSVETTRSFDQGLDIQEHRSTSSRTTLSSSNTRGSSTLGDSLSSIGLNKFADSNDDNNKNSDNNESQNLNPIIGSLTQDLTSLYSSDDAQKALALLQQMSPSSSSSSSSSSSDVLVTKESLIDEKERPIIKLESASESNNQKSDNGRFKISSPTLVSDMTEPTSQPVSPLRAFPLATSLSDKRSVLSLTDANAELELRRVDLLARKAESDDLASSIEAIRERALAHLSQADLLVASMRSGKPISISSSSAQNNSARLDEPVTASHIQSETDRIAAFLSRRKLQPIPGESSNLSLTEKPSLSSVGYHQETALNVSTQSLTKLSLTAESSHVLSGNSSLVAPRRVAQQQGNKIIWLSEASQPASFTTTVRDDNLRIDSDQMIK